MVALTWDASVWIPNSVVTTVAHALHALFARVGVVENPRVARIPDAVEFASHADL